MTVDEMLMQPWTPTWTRNWTQDTTGRENSSDLFESLVKEVARLIRGDAHALLAGRAESTARLVLAQLAHVHGLTPVEEGAVNG